MLTYVDWKKLNLKEKQDWLKRPEKKNNLKDQVADIIARVRREGDEALFALSQEFDGVALKDLEAKKPGEKLFDPSYVKALEKAIETISLYHQALIPQAKIIKTAPGVFIQQEHRAIERVGLYVPSGLVSSLLMQAIPAKIAGCSLRIAVTPPNAKGQIDSALWLAAKYCDLDAFYLVGGAQAIAAMAYGTETIPKVDKIFGPGNAYVAEAKAQVALDPQGVAIDLPAGPSELMILADSQANPEWLAADLLAQAEHGPDSQVILVTETEALAKGVDQALRQQLNSLPRASIAAKALSSGAIIFCPELKEQLAIANAYAPEHLSLNRLDAHSLISEISSAGTVFIGPWAAETLGDYITGSNHILPTHGFARSFSGLSLKDFFKTINFQSVSKEGVRHLGQEASFLARVEGLEGHARAIDLRLKALE